MEEIFISSQTTDDQSEFSFIQRVTRKIDPLEVFFIAGLTLIHIVVFYFVFATAIPFEFSYVLGMYLSASFMWNFVLSSNLAFFLVLNGYNLLKIHNSETKIADSIKRFFILNFYVGLVFFSFVFLLYYFYLFNDINGGLRFLLIGSLVFLTLAYFFKQSYKKASTSEFSVVKSEIGQKKAISKIFYTFYLINILLLLTYLIQNNESGVINLEVSLFINSALVFLIPLALLKSKVKPSRFVIISFSAIFIVFQFQVYTIYPSAFYFDNYYSNIVFLYLVFGVFIYFIVKRDAITSFLIKFWSFINPLRPVYYYLTTKRLKNNTEAMYFVKKYISLQTRELKDILPGMTPNTVEPEIKYLLSNDLDRLKALFAVNDISVYSDSAIMKLVMSMASPVIQDIREILRQHITLELLKKGSVSNDNGNGTNDYVLNIAEVWTQVNKRLIQFHSQYTDEELKFHDTLMK